MEVFNSPNLQEMQPVGTIFGAYLKFESFFICFAGQPVSSLVSYPPAHKN